MDMTNKTHEEYAIWLVNTINKNGCGINISVLLAAGEIDRLISVLSSIKGMSKIHKISFFKKVKIYLANM